MFDPKIEKVAAKALRKIQRKAKDLKPGEEIELTLYKGAYLSGFRKEVNLNPDRWEKPTEQVLRSRLPIDFQVVSVKVHPCVEVPFAFDTDKLKAVIRYEPSPQLAFDL
jgi:hypothetical protein